MDTHKTPKRPLIVVIDDSTTVQKILEVTFHREGCEVISFSDPVQALGALIGGEIPVPDLVFVDIGLPRMDGYTVMQYLKKERTRFPHMTIIGLSARDGVLDRLKARLAGAHTYLTKPFTTLQLLALLKEYGPDRAP